jgi:hypothetical protein
MTSIKSHSTKELQMMRIHLKKGAQHDLNVFGYTIAEIDEEIEFRASQRFPKCDEQPENPILDMGQSIIPKTAY